MPLLIDPTGGSNNYRRRYNGPSYGGYGDSAPSFRSPQNMDEAYGGPMLPQRVTAPRTGYARPGAPLLSSPSAPSLPFTPNTGATLANRFGGQAAQDQFIQSQRTYGSGAPTLTGTSQTVMPTTPYTPAPQFHDGGQMPLSLMGAPNGQDPHQNFNAPRQAVPGPSMSMLGYVTGSAPTLSQPGSQTLSAPNMAPRVLPQYQEDPSMKFARQDALMARHAAEGPFIAAPYDQSEMRQNAVAGAGVNESGSRADYNRASAQDLPNRTQAIAQSGADKGAVADWQKRANEMQQDRDSYMRHSQNLEGQINALQKELAQFRAGKGQVSQPKPVPLSEDDRKLAEKEGLGSVGALRMGKMPGDPSTRPVTQPTAPQDLDSANRAFSKSENRYYHKVNGEWVPE